MCVVVSGALCCSRLFRFERRTRGQSLFLDLLLGRSLSWNLVALRCLRLLLLADCLLCVTLSITFFTFSLPIAAT